MAHNKMPSSRAKKDMGLCIICSKVKCNLDECKSINCPKKKAQE